MRRAGRHAHSAAELSREALLERDTAARERVHGAVTLDNHLFIPCVQEDCHVDVRSTSISQDLDTHLLVGVARDQCTRVDQSIVPPVSHLSDD